MIMGCLSRHQVIHCNAHVICSYLTLPCMYIRLCIYTYTQMISEMEKLILKADPVTLPPPTQSSDRTSNDKITSDRRSRGSHSESGPHPGSDKKGEEGSGRGSPGGGTGVEVRQTNSSKQKIVVKNVTERGGRQLFSLKSVHYQAL